LKTPWSVEVQRQTPQKAQELSLTAELFQNGIHAHTGTGLYRKQFMYTQATLLAKDLSGGRMPCKNMQKRGFNQQTHMISWARNENAG
jgi:hypothetical protein